MPKQQLIDKIRELKKELTELDKQITETEKKIQRPRSGQNKEVENLKKQLEDLKRKKDEGEKERNNLQKLVELQGNVESKEKNIKKLKSQIKELEQNNEQVKELKKEIVDLKQNCEELKNEIIKLNNDIQELKKRIEEKDNSVLLLEKVMEEDKLNHNNKMEDTTAKHEKEIIDLKRENRAEIEQQKENHSREMEEIRTTNKWLEDEVKQSKTERLKMEKDIYTFKKVVSRYCAEENQPILCIGQLCSELQTNWYRYVMPKRCHENCAYKVKNIIEDLDSDMLSETEQIDAERRWKELQSKTNWKKNKRLIEAIKRLQQKRNQAAHPNLTVEIAKKAAEELREQGKLNVKPSFEDVLELIELWLSSKSL